MIYLCCGNDSDAAGNDFAGITSNKKVLHCPDVKTLKKTINFQDFVKSTILAKLGFHFRQFFQKKLAAKLVLGKNLHLIDHIWPSA